jgi:hypothetical protein
MVGTVERMVNNFSGGILYGIFGTVAIFYVCNQINNSRRRIGRQNRTLDTFSDAEQSRLTAANIVKDSLLGIFSCIFWVVILLFVGFLLIRLAAYIMNFKN